MQDTFLGAVATADAGRAGLFPVKLYSHAIDYLLTAAPVRTMEDFDRLRMASPGGAMDAMKASKETAVETAWTPGRSLSRRISRAGFTLLSASPRPACSPRRTASGCRAARRRKRRSRRRRIRGARGGQRRIFRAGGSVSQLSQCRDQPPRSRRPDAMAMHAAGGEDAMKRDMILWRKAEIEAHGQTGAPTSCGPHAENGDEFAGLFRHRPQRRGRRGLCEPLRRAPARPGATDLRLSGRAGAAGAAAAPAAGAERAHQGRGRLRAENRGRDVAPRAPTKILVLVHGFNTSFSAVAERALELGAGLDYAGTILAWSWPSEGSAFSYPYDEDSSAWSEPHLADLVTKIAALAPDLRIDFVAHSMGNRILLQMLRDFALEKANLRIGVAVFAAPDVSQDVFRQQMRQVRKHRRPAHALRVGIRPGDRDFRELSQRAARGQRRRLHSGRRRHRIGRRAAVRPFLCVRRAQGDARFQGDREPGDQGAAARPARAGKGRRRLLADRALIGASPRKS